MTAREKWTAEEVAVLKEHYRKHGAFWEEWDRLLPNRTRNAINKKASALGIAHERYWTPEEDAVLRMHYENKPGSWKGWRELLPHKTRKQQKDRAQQLGLISPHGKGGWNDRQRKRLILAVRSVSLETGHTFLGCVKELNNMRIHGGLGRLTGGKL